MADRAGAPGRPAAVRVGVGALWVAAGIGVLVHLGLTVRVLVVVVGAALVAHGLLDAVAAVRLTGPATERVVRAASAATGLALGVLALAWPDVTLVVVAVLFGVRLVLLGVEHAWAALRGTARGRDARRRRGAPARARAVVAVGGATLAVSAVVVTAAAQAGVPRVDDFYDAPRTQPDEPGRLVRSAPFDHDDVPAGARGWRILYTTTLADGRPGLASGLVVVPDGGAVDGSDDATGARPVVAWAHGTTGVARHCAPSVLPEPFTAGAMFVLDDVLAEGWAFVATDYVGLGTDGPHAYLVGAGAAHAVLDAVRAARELDDAHLAPRTVVWGHSQGGAAALWTGALAREHAPDVPLDGVAALAPAANLPALVDSLGRVRGGSVLGSYVLTSYAAVYPDVDLDAQVRPGAVGLVRTMARRCLSEPGVLASALTAGTDLLAWTRDRFAGVPHEPGCPTDQG